MHAVAFAARKLADLLLLIGALEIEARHIGARRNVAIVHTEHIESAGDFLPDVLLIVEIIARLIDKAEFDALADCNLAGVWLVGPGDHAEQSRFAGAV